MKKFEKILIIPPGYAVGDNFCIVSLAQYLLEFYEKVYLGMTNEEYFIHYIKNDPLLNKRLFLVHEVNYVHLLNQSESSTFHICNTFTGCWQKADWNLFDHPAVNKDFYFNDQKYLYEKIDIPQEHRCYDQIHLQPHRPSLEINHLIYYKLVGLNNRVRMDYFQYHRNLNEEINLKNEIMKKAGLKNGDKYNICNIPIDVNISSYLRNGLPTINIDFLAKFPGMLMKLVEDSEEIHFVEGSNVNFFYLSQYKKIFNYNKPIYFHVWARDRDWPMYNLDKAYKMMATPKLNN